jgi:hypothetical protein
MAGIWAQKITSAGFNNMDTWDKQNLLLVSVLCIYFLLNMKRFACNIPNN